MLLHRDMDAALIREFRGLTASALRIPPDAAAPLVRTPRAPQHKRAWRDEPRLVSSLKTLAIPSLRPASSHHRAPSAFCPPKPFGALMAISPSRDS
jgi:hypothetical protein